MNLASVVGAALVATVMSGTVNADPRPITVVTKKERSSENVGIAAGLAGAGALVGALGVYFHLDGRSASDDVNAKVFTGDIWTQDKVDRVDHAESRRTYAAVSYGVGGALLVSALVYFIATDPGEDTVVITPRATPIIAPQPGGAFLGGAWSF